VEEENEEELEVDVVGDESEREEEDQCDDEEGGQCNNGKMEGGRDERLDRVDYEFMDRVDCERVDRVDCERVDRVDCERVDQTGCERVCITDCHAGNADRKYGERSRISPDCTAHTSPLNNFHPIAGEINMDRTPAVRVHHSYPYCKLGESAHDYSTTIKETLFLHGTDKTIASVTALGKSHNTTVLQSLSCDDKRCIQVMNRTIHQRMPTQHLTSQFDGDASSAFIRNVTNYETLVDVASVAIPKNKSHLIANILNIS